MKCIIATLILLFPINVHALEYSVEWPPSDNPHYLTLAVTIEDCKTLFKIEPKQLDSFSKSDSALDELVRRSIKRFKEGCK